MELTEMKRESHIVLTFAGKLHQERSAELPVELVVNHNDCVITVEYHIRGVDFQTCTKVITDYHTLPPDQQARKRNAVIKIAQAGARLARLQNLEKDATMRGEAKAWSAKIADGRNLSQEKKSELEEVGFGLLEYNANNGGVLKDIIEGDGIVKHDDDTKEDDDDEDVDDKEDMEDENNKGDDSKGEDNKGKDNKGEDNKGEDSKGEVKNVDKEVAVTEKIGPADKSSEELNGVLFLLKKGANKETWLKKLIKYAANKKEDDDSDSDSEVDFSDFDEDEVNSQDEIIEVVVKKEKVKTKGLVETNKDSHILQEKSRGWVKKQKRGRRRLT